MISDLCDAPLPAAACRTRATSFRRRPCLPNVRRCLSPPPPPRIAVRAVKLSLRLTRLTKELLAHEFALLQGRHPRLLADELAPEVQEFARLARPRHPLRISHHEPLRRRRPCIPPPPLRRLSPQQVYSGSVNRISSLLGSEQSYQCKKNDMDGYGCSIYT